jgi:leucyl/phenylalanyl-tRNA--protein transferase
MTIEAFPPVETADEDGLLAIGGDLEPASVLLAYRSGIFPWPISARTLAWFAPPERGVLFLDEFHISRRLRDELKKGRFTTKVNADFVGVINRCAEVKNRGTQRSTWITRPMREAYTELNRLGFAHSFESYANDVLVGGLYGIQIGRFFAAESSFFRVSNASKIAMIRLAEHLKEQGIGWFDCQVLTPFSESFGARSIPRQEFMQLLDSAIRAS